MKKGNNGKQMRLKQLICEYRISAALLAAGTLLMLTGSLIGEKTTDSAVGVIGQTDGAVNEYAQSTAKNDFELYADYEERRLASILSNIDGAGKLSVAVYVTATPSDDGRGLAFPEIKGVLVYAEGAKSASVREKIVRAIASLYSLPLSKISVLF